MLNEGKKILSTKNDLSKSGRFSPVHLLPNIHWASATEKGAGGNGEEHSSPLNKNVYAQLMSIYEIRNIDRALLIKKIIYLIQGSNRKNKYRYTSEGVVAAADVIKRQLQLCKFPDKKIYRNFRLLIGFLHTMLLNDKS